MQLMVTSQCDGLHVWISLELFNPTVRIFMITRGSSATNSIGHPSIRQGFCIFLKYAEIKKKKTESPTTTPMTRKNGHE